MSRKHITITGLYSHGDIRRYWKSCRCRACRVAKSDYDRMRRLAVQQGARNRIVQADRARAHIVNLRKSGIRLIQIAGITGIQYQQISQIGTGLKRGLRERKERLILAVRSTAGGLILRF